ncbi:MAG: hypothetical protein WDA59_07595 [Methanofastidiosum sp.]
MKKENIYVMNLEAAYIYKDIINGKKISSKKRDLNKLFSATIPYSLETIRINRMFPDTFYIVNKKQYTKKIINITFDKNYTMWDEENNKRVVLAHKKKIRKYLYNNGFVMDNIRYVFYKRGSGKAKDGHALFIQDDMRDLLIDRSRLGLKFEEDEETDLTSLLAYESLVTSSIEFVIKLDTKTELLLIDDIYGEEFETVASVTREKNGEIITGNEKIKLKNCLTDGQGLLDESVFKKYGKENNGFMLLRNDMFKCCAFNTKLQEWFKHCQIIKLTDMFGNEYDADKIKLVATPNSLKFLKFDYKVGNGTRKECYDHWINNVDSAYGVVKCDKDTNYGNYNRTTYQLLNSIPNLTKDDLMELSREEREYVNLLKNDDAVFRNYILRDYKLLHLFNESIDNGNLSSYETMDLMNCLLLVNSDIQYTKKFKKMKGDLINNYIDNLKSGRLRLKDTRYVTLFSNPYEMLLATVGEYDKKSIMQGREIYCPHYDNGQEFCASRNPHINAGNVMYTVNKYHEEYDDWFNFTNNICAINFFDNDAPDRLQGCDSDGDVLLLLPHPILIQKAKYCEENFTTPINMVEGRAVPRKNNMDELHKLDIILSENYIGKIVNLSQIINSYMNDFIFGGKSSEIIDELYQLTSKLSSLSQIEIDKSKKIFDNVNMYREYLKTKRNELLSYVGQKDKLGNMVEKMVVPNFFSRISTYDEYRVFRKFHTPMDILQEVLEFDNASRTKNVEFGELLISPGEVDHFKYNNQVKVIYDIVSYCGRKINGLQLKTCGLNDKAKLTVRRREKQKAIAELKKYKINISTVLNILRRCFGLTRDTFGFSKYAMLCLNLLFKTNKLEVVKCFRSKDISNDDVLIEVDNDWDYNIFGKYYRKLFDKDTPNPCKY